MTPGGSTFWPKFYKGLEKAIAKIEAAPVVVVDDAVIARLVKAAKTTRAVAVEAAPANLAAPASSGPALDGPPLGQAAAHLEAGRVQPAIEAMRVAWCALGRVPAIADMIDRATRLLPAWDRALAPTDKAAEAAWSAAFAADPQAAMPQLLEYLCTGGVQVAERNLLQLTTLPEDPRIGARLAQLAASRAISGERTQYWKSLFEIIARIRDPRTVPALRAVFGSFEGKYHNHRQARRMVGEWALATPPPPQLAPADSATLERIGNALTVLEANRDATERTLVDAIADAWADPAPRLVYADWLAERAHPRGELLVLASKPKPNAREIKRQRELVRKTTNLFGPLDAFGTTDQDDRGLGLDRGLPTMLHARWNTSLLSWGALVGYPLMAVVRTIEFEYSATLPEPRVIARILLDPTTQRLAKLKAVLPDNVLYPAEPHEARMQLYWNELKLFVDAKWVQNGRDLVRA